MSARRSVRRFTDQPVPREAIEALLRSAIQAPSPSNRQPWQFAVITDPEIKRQLVEDIQQVAEQMAEVIGRSHHREDFSRYSDFFFEPLQRAPVVIIPSYRVHDDLIERLLLSGGATAGQFTTPAAMQGELACTAAAVMNLLEQAHRDGLGACWMAGPTIAREAICDRLQIRSPWTMLGAIALGWPDEVPEPRSRRSLKRVVRWF